MAINDSCVDDFIRKGRTLIGALLECGAGKYFIEYLSWGLSTDGQRCVEREVRMFDYKWFNALVKCGYLLHEAIVLRAIDKLESQGYKVIWRSDEYPEEIKKYGDPDLIAVKDNEIVIFEAKVDDQLNRYSRAAKEVDGKLIIAINVLTGRNIEVWGLDELNIE